MARFYPKRAASTKWSKCSSYSSMYYRASWWNTEPGGRTGLENKTVTMLCNQMPVATTDFQKLPVRGRQRRQSHCIRVLQRQVYLIKSSSTARTTNLGIFLPVQAQAALGNGWHTTHHQGAEGANKQPSPTPQTYSTCKVLAHCKAVGSGSAVAAVLHISCSCTSFFKENRVQSLLQHG